MQTIRLKVADLLDPTGQKPLDQVPDVTVLTPLVLQQYGFLPQVADSRMRHRPAADHGGGSACHSRTHE